MDLNDLLHRHQLSLMRRDAAATMRDEATHQAAACGYARLIAALRLDVGATAMLVEGCPA